MRVWITFKKIQFATTSGVDISKWQSKRSALSPAAVDQVKKQAVAERKQLRSICDVIEQLPAPGDTDKGGPLHRLPRLQWKTWMRLALIPSGGDWRDLNKVAWQNLRVTYEPRRGAYEVANWMEPSRAVTSTAGPGRSNGVTAVSDPRLHINGEGKTNILRVQSIYESAVCVTGASGPHQGAACISDPRVVNRPGRYTDQFRMQAISEPAARVTGSTDVQNGAQLVADHRIKSATCTETSSVMSLNFSMEKVVGSKHVHIDSKALSNLQIPDDNKQGVWMIIAQDGTWHRPLTTYELAMLQSFPTHLPDGRPFQLEGCSDAKAREFIGNAVPCDSAEEMGNVILLAGAQAEAGIAFEMSWNPVWVAPDESHIPSVIH